MEADPYLLFDLDGTLSDPLDGIARSVNFALAAFGYETRPHGDLARFIGPPLDLTFRELADTGDEARIRDLVERFREYFGRQGYAENRLYPGIPEILERLHCQGLSMAVCTAKRKDFAERIIRMFGLAAYFQFTSGGDIGVRKGDQIRQLLDRGLISPQSVMIGDREGDITAARENGLRSAGVLWGYGSREELASVRPDWLFESPEALSGLIHQIQEVP